MRDDAPACSDTAHICEASGTTRIEMSIRLQLCSGVGCCRHVHTPTAPPALCDELSVTRQMGSDEGHRLQGRLP